MAPLGECELWTGAVHDQGYGQHGRGILAHRTAYEKNVGPIPEGHEIHHTCEERLCVNPAHLQLVTRSEHLRLHRGVTECPRCGSTRPRIQNWRNGRPNGTKCRDCQNRKMREKRRKR